MPEKTERHEMTDATIKAGKPAYRVESVCGYIPTMRGDVLKLHGAGKDVGKIF